VASSVSPRRACILAKKVWIPSTNHARAAERAIASPRISTRYAYDDDGNVTQVTYPSSRTVTYTRDTLGRISGVTTKKDSGSASVTLASDVAYQPFGPLQSLTYGKGLSLWKTFTSDYLLDVLLVEDPSIPQDIVNLIAHERRDGRVHRARDRDGGRARHSHSEPGRRGLH
jgi:YD repeat-containing protein